MFLVLLKMETVRRALENGCEEWCNAQAWSGQ